MRATSAIFGLAVLVLLVGPLALGLWLMAVGSRLRAWEKYSL